VSPQWLPLDTCRFQHSSCLSTGFKGVSLPRLPSQVSICLCPAWLGSSKPQNRGSCAWINCTAVLCPTCHSSLVFCLQLVQDFKLLLIVGRRLVFPAQSNAAVCADMTTQVQFKGADGTTVMRTVSLMFPANCRTVVRLMEAWYDAQVGLSMLGSGCTAVQARHQQPRSLHGPWPCHAPKRPSLLLAHFPLAHCEHKRGPCQPSSSAADGMQLCHGPCTKATLLAHFTLATL
jgi:hypothetical protein